MKITFQIPEILIVIAGIILIGASFGSVSGEFVFLALFFTALGLLLRFLSWSLELAKEPEPQERKRK